MTGSSMIRVSFFYIFYAQADGDPIEPTLMGGNLPTPWEGELTHKGNEEAQKVRRVAWPVTSGPGC